jgi:hypothetical protein
MEQAVREVDQGDRISPTNTLLGSAALFMCLPGIFGGLGTFLPQLFKPETHWALKTAWDQLVVDIYTWSIALAMLSPPTTLVGLALGVSAIRRAGRSTAFRRTMAGVLAATILLFIPLAVRIVGTIYYTPHP